MAGRDNVLYHASITSGAAAGTVIPLSLQYGIENVRQGYGRAILKNIRAIYSGYNSGTQIGIPIEIKNSNWIDAAGLTAVKINSEVACSRNSLSFMRGRDMELMPNTSFTVNAILPASATAAGDVYVIFEIEYSDVQGFEAEKQKGAPVLKTCSNASVTAAANIPTTLGSFDNLLSNTEYILAEVSGYGISETACNFLIVEGFSNQRGLTRIFPIRNYGVAEQIEGSVILTKQTYNLAIIAAGALSAAAISIRMELVANKN